MGEFTAKDNAICELAELVRDMHKEATAMSTTTIPGLKSGHRIITPQCRANRGTTEAFQEAAQRLQKLYDNYARSEGNEGVKWHLVLVRDESRDD